MRDSVLSEALQRLAAEAATRLSSLVACGEEVPFDVAENSGEVSLFYRYDPLTADFIAERHEELRSLPAWGPARAAVNVSGVAAAFLEARGVTVPEDPDERAEKMLFAFIASLWEGSTDFALDRSKLEKAIHVLRAEAREVYEADVLIAPIVGLQMPVPRLALPNGVRVVRADSVDAPIEAMRSEGMHRSAWEPQFLALVEQGDGPGASIAAMRQLRELISVLRLFKEGGVGLGPYVFAPTGEGKWQRVATGAPGTRSGGFSLTETEAADLADFAGRLEARPDPTGSLAWAVGRFEMGCERPTALEGLSDHLLALRALLEGDGPVGAALPMRAAALIADPDERPAARARFEQAFTLEQSLISTAGLVQTGEDTGAAIELSIWVEEGLRAMLREAALGELGGDIGHAADESLIASGLLAGEVSVEQMGSTAEWDAIEPELAEAEEALDGDGTFPASGTTRLLEPIPGDGEIRVTALDPPPPPPPPDPPPPPEPEPSRDRPGPPHDPDEEKQMINRDWLSEVSREERATMEWPATSASLPPRERERIDTPRVRHLFQVPEDAEWEVRELDYDRTAGAKG